MVEAEKPQEFWLASWRPRIADGVLVTQSCLTLCNFMDWSSSGSLVDTEFRDKSGFKLGD